ncbi:MAG: YHS domain-containing protein [Planctomycetes bacterium]|nr:YHS domain-containing protein [Planctomycetota bacterium]
MFQRGRWRSSSSCVGAFPRRLVAPLVFGFVVESTALAHDVSDPVCGMKLDADKVSWKESYAGETYCFCQEADLRAFRADPEKYADVVTVLAHGSLGEYRLQVRPNPPRAGDAAQLALTLPVGVSPDASVSAIIFHLSPNREELERDHQVLHRADDSRFFAMDRYFDRAGLCRLWVRVRLPDGRTDGVGLRFSIASPEAQSARPTDSILSMGEQHELMKRIGRNWATVESAIAANLSEPEIAAGALDDLRQDMKHVPSFELHHFQEDQAEHAILAREAGQALSALSRAVNVRNADLATKLNREIDGRHCTKCHLKFRWGIVDDLSRFPDVTRRPE